MTIENGTHTVTGVIKWGHAGPRMTHATVEITGNKRAQIDLSYTEMRALLAAKGETVITVTAGVAKIAPHP
ncbi:MAG: hypothetical protein GC131_01395 [Alphaproteobacteria bacterium]|nr:hypothetical protein [Alphaproteobacteria bacterium]